MHDPRSVIDRQLAAYNARDLEAWLATYSPSAEQVLADGTVLARGHSAIRERMEARFADSALHAALVQRIVIGNAVLDHEHVTRTGPEGLETVEMACLYDVRDGAIARVTFAFGDPMRRAAPRST